MHDFFRAAWLWCSGGKKLALPWINSLYAAHTLKIEARGYLRPTLSFLSGSSSCHLAARLAQKDLQTVRLWRFPFPADTSNNNHGRRSCFMPARKSGVINSCIFYRGPQPTAAADLINMEIWWTGCKRDSAGRQLINLCGVGFCVSCQSGENGVVSAWLTVDAHNKWKSRAAGWYLNGIKGVYLTRRSVFWK